MLVKFWQPGCGGCRALLIELEKLAAECGERLLILENERPRELSDSRRARISLSPALAVYRNGRFDRFIGGVGKKDAILQQIFRVGRVLSFLSIAVHLTPAVDTCSIFATFFFEPLSSWIQRRVTHVKATTFHVTVGRGARSRSGCARWTGAAMPVRKT